MKKTMLIICCAFAVSAYSQNATVQMQNNKDKGKYCASLKDGKMILMTDGKMVTSDVLLADGTKITTDATVVKKDGTKNVLRNGECVDKNGKPEKMTQIEKEK